MSRKLNRRHVGSKVELCAPAIWRKLNDFEKRAWKVFYEAFRFDALLPAGVKVSKNQMEVVAHNFACQAVWNLHKVFRKVCGKTRQA